MLAPVAGHQSRTKCQKWQDKDAKCGLGMAILVQQSNGDVIADLPERSPERSGVLPLSQEIQEQIQPNKEKEPANIEGKVDERVSIIPHG